MHWQLQTAAWGAYFVCATCHPLAPAESACHPLFVCRCHNHQKRRRRIIEEQSPEWDKKTQDKWARAGPEQSQRLGQDESREFCVILTDFLLCWQCKQPAIPLLSLPPLPLSTLCLSAFICSAQSWRFCLIRVTQLTNDAVLPQPASCCRRESAIVPLCWSYFAWNYAKHKTARRNKIYKKKIVNKKERNTKQIEWRNCQMRFNVMLKWLCVSGGATARSGVNFNNKFRVTTEESCRSNGSGSTSSHAIFQNLLLRETFAIWHRMPNKVETTKSEGRNRFHPNQNRRSWATGNALRVQP